MTGSRWSSSITPTDCRARRSRSAGATWLGLLAEDGLEVEKVLVTSALTGAGVPQLRSLIADAVHSGAAARERLSADLDAVGAALVGSVADHEADPAALQGEHVLVEALAQAAGVPPVLDAIEEDYQRGAMAAGGWPVTRWARSVQAGPVAALAIGLPLRARQRRG